MDKHVEKLLELLYYSSSSAYNSVSKLYDAVKTKGVKRDAVKEWVQSQKAYQLFKKPPRTTKHFPITSTHKNRKWQADLMDMSNISKANGNVKYILVCIDVFSRFAWAVALKDKKTETIIEGMTYILGEARPEILMCDLGSEFISREFKALMKEHTVTVLYSEVDDHRVRGIVDRFIRTLREKINAYQDNFDTMKYIDVLPSIIRGYSSSTHSGSKKPQKKLKLWILALSPSI